MKITSYNNTIQYNTARCSRNGKVVNFGDKSVCIKEINGLIDAFYIKKKITPPNITEILDKIPLAKVMSESRREVNIAEFFKAIGIKVRYDKDNLNKMIISHYEPRIKGRSFSDLGIDDSHFLDNVVRIQGDCDLRESNIKSIPVETIAGNVYLGKNQTDTGNLQIIGGNLEISGNPKITKLWSVRRGISGDELKSLGSIRYAEDIHCPELVKAPNLVKIKTLWSPYNLTNIKKLKTATGTLFFESAELEKLPKSLNYASSVVLSQDNMCGVKRLNFFSSTKGLTEVSDNCQIWGDKAGEGDVGRLYKDNYNGDFFFKITFRDLIKRYFF